MVQTTLRVSLHIGNNSTSTRYVLPFRCIREEFVYVQVQDQLGQVRELERSEYQVFIVGENSAEVTTTVAIPATSRVATYRSVRDYLQTVDYRNHDAFPAETHETALDIAMMGIQELAEELSRTPTGTFFEPVTIDFVRYGQAQDLTDVQRAQGSRNIYAWHFAGNLNGEDPNFIENAEACGPFIVGQIWAVEVNPLEDPQFPPPLPGPDGIVGTPDDIPGEFGPDGIPGTPDDVEPVFDTPVSIEDNDDNVRILEETTFFVVMKNSAVWEWKNFLQLQIGSTFTPSLGPLNPAPHVYQKPWIVDPQKGGCGCAAHGGTP